MDSVGPYELLERIGQGGMGEIYLAVLRRPGAFEKWVALKRVLPAVAGDPEFLRMFHREARVAALLNHQNIVHVYDYGSEGDAAFMAMEYVDGADLGTLLARLGPPDLICALTILTGVARALDYAHRRTDREGRPLSIVHRDVSPGNVLLSREGEVKLTDFGLVTGLPDEHRSEAGVLKGKYAYVAPEQAAGAAVDARADLFSWGVMAYELLAGRRPFTGTLLETLMAMRDGRYDPLHAELAPEPLLDLVHQCLSCRREQRPADAAAVLSRLDALPHKPDATAQLAAWVRSGAGDAALRRATPVQTEVGAEPFREVGQVETPDGIADAFAPTEDTSRVESAASPIPPPHRRSTVVWLGLLAAPLLVLSLWYTFTPDGDRPPPVRQVRQVQTEAISDTGPDVSPDAPPEVATAAVGEGTGVVTVNIAAVPDLSPPPASLDASSSPDPMPLPEPAPVSYGARWRSRDLDLRGHELRPIGDGLEQQIDFSREAGDFSGTLGARLRPEGPAFNLELLYESRPWSIVEVSGQRAESRSAPLLVEGLRAGRVPVRLTPLGEGEGYQVDLYIQPLTD